MLNCLRVDVSRPTRKWTQYYTALGELLLEFETVLKKVWSESEIIELISFSLNYYIIIMLYN